MNALEIRDLCKSYKGFSLGPLNLTLPSGCIMGLVGENGAGKSTTIKLILDMIRRDRGQIIINGRDNRENAHLMREDIGVVLDEVGLPGRMTALEIGKVMNGIFQNWDAAAYADYLHRFSLPDNKKFKDFSKGMKMKLGISVALAHHAKLLLLDEATAGLDPVVRDEVVGLFGEFTREPDHTVLISSHIISDLEKICDYMVFLHQGKLLLCEEKDRLSERYGLLRCGAEELRALRPETVIGKRESPYGVEAVVERDGLPAGLSVGPVDLEQLFISMIRKEN